MVRWVWAVSLVAGGCSVDTTSAVLRDGLDHGTKRRLVVLPEQTQLGGDPSGLRWEPAFSVPLGSLQRLRARASQRSGLAQPDLGAVLSAEIPASWSDQDARDFAAGIQDTVEWSVLRLSAVPSPEDIRPTTPSFVDAQSYRSAAVGIDVDGARAQGYRGAGVSIHEVEYGWRGTHEDLVDVDLHPEPGQTVASAAFEMGLAPEHGTASVGMLIAPDNDYGIDGMVPDAAVYTYPEWTEEGGLRRAGAVAAAVAQAEPGDIVMLQMQAQHPQTGQFGPAELEPDVWMLTRMATDAGVLVVAAGGNGALDLDGVDAEDYAAMGDSGAILVGAGSPDDRVALPFSSHGRRIDLQGWGASVFSLGYGDFQRLDEDDNQAYTNTFEGTSAALPVVVSAAALLIEAFVVVEGSPPDPQDVRRLLVATGHAQGGEVHVGPLPNVTAAIAWVGAREADAPTVEVSGPAEDLDMLVDLDDELVIDVEVSVADESPIYRVELEVDGEVLLAVDETPPFGFEHVRLPEGQHALRARATDVWGNTSWSELRSISVSVESKPGGSSTGHTDVSSGSGDEGSTDVGASSPGKSGCQVGPEPGRAPALLWGLFLAIAWPRRRAS
ncbi:MAG: S8 family serine peptidase [Nannocystales bacterium]